MFGCWRNVAAAVVVAAVVAVDDAAVNVSVVIAVAPAKYAAATNSYSETIENYKIAVSIDHSPEYWHLNYFPWW